MVEHYFGITDPGLLRSNNEDSFIAKTIAKKHIVLACVIDGVGGYSGGEIAARLTKEEILHQLNKVPDRITPRLVAALEEANARIMREKAGNASNENMACVATLTLVDLVKHRLYYAHVGDTRLYLFRDGSLVKITHDHSAVGFLEETGRLTEEAAMAHPKRNEINKALGFEAQPPHGTDFIESGESPFLPGDTILLCSDGLTDMVPTAGIIEILSAPTGLEAKCRQLVAAANKAGGKDNITAVLVQHNKLPTRHSVMKPVALKNETANSAEPETNVESSAQPEIASLPTAPKRRSGWLAWLCLALLILCGWLAWQQYFVPAPVPPVNTDSVVRPAKNAGELALAAEIGASVNNVVQLDSGQRVMLTGPLHVANDSLTILGKDAVIECNPGYMGPAFVIGSNNRYVLLDGVALRDFSIGLNVSSTGLHLKAVQFINCPTPLQAHPFIKPGVSITGHLAGTLFKFTDSIPQ